MSRARTTSTPATSSRRELSSSLTIGTSPLTKPSLNVCPTSSAGISIGMPRRTQTQRPFRPNASWVLRSNSIPENTSSATGVGACPCHHLKHLLTLTLSQPVRSLGPGYVQVWPSRCSPFNNLYQVLMSSAGIHLADASMWLASVSVLAAFSVAPPVKDGKPVIPSGAFLDGSIRYVSRCSTL